MAKPKPIRVGDRFVLGDGQVWKVISHAFGVVGMFCESKSAFVQLQTRVVRQRERAPVVAMVEAA